MTRMPPRDPAVRALVRAAQASALSRRRLLGTGLFGASAAALTACAPPAPPAGGVAALKLPTDVSETEKICRWSNWTAYLDYDEETKTYPTLEAFNKESGIHATYSEDIEDNDHYVSKVNPQLKSGQDIGADIFTLTDWMANRMIQERLVQPLELIRMPNVAANMLPTLKEVSFDPGRNNSVTWQSGFAGIGYNKAKIGRDLKSLDELFTDELKGKVTVLSEMRDTLGLMMQWQGVDISGNWGKTEFDKALEKFNQLVSDNYIRRIKGNSYLNDLKSGNAVAGIVWSGDLFILRAETEDPNWQFVIPESGGTLWSDNMMVPITSTHRRSAEELINYYYEPEVAAQVAAYVNYVSPVLGAQKVLAKTDPELADSPFIFPGEDYIKEHHIQGFRALTPEEDADYSAAWAKVVGN